MKLQNIIRNSISHLLDQYSILRSIVNRIDDEAGIAYLVGGAVRDLLLDRPISDMDIEVHGLSLDELAGLLSDFGIVNLVGKSFGVLKVNGIDIDWSLPRTDLGGRKPQVFVDASMSIVDALKRRDLTINAMAINLNTYEFIDPFDGYTDLNNKLLRSPDVQFFTEDPLRFYRVMQFVSRFEMFPDSALNQVCESMDISTVSVERIELEFEKLMLKSVRPSLGIRWIKSINRLKEVFPELHQAVGVEQEKSWHPEGDVFEHLMQSFDSSSSLIYGDKNEKITVMYSALCHDLGKITTTKLVDGRLRSFGHEVAGVPFTKSLLNRITRKKAIISAVALLVRYHMLPGQFVKQKTSLAAYRRLALKLKNYVTLDTLAKLACADARGRNGKSSLPLDIDVEFVGEFIKRAKEAGVFVEFTAQILHGRDIKDYVEPGPEMGQILKYAYKLQIEKGISNKDELLEVVIDKFGFNNLKKEAKKWK